MMPFFRKSSPPHQKDATVSRSLQPHILIFAFLCLLYFLPLWLVSFGTYEGGGVLTVAIDAQRVMGRIALAYLLGFVFFCIGSWSVPKVCWLLGARSAKRLRVANLRIYPSDYFLLLILVGGFLLSKLLLIPEGVYSNYVFGSGAGESSIWTASMFLSDALVLASIVALFSSNRRNLLFFFAISVLSGINLLHGTRNFFVIAVLAFVVYSYLRSNISMVKMAVYGTIGFLAAVSLAYAVFLSRSHVAEANFSLLDILSPITYESVFSQMALISLFNHPMLFSTVGNPFHLLQDIFVFTTPRFLFAHKEDALWIGQYAYLSPLGALNGFAAGLLYFGYLFPLFYYFMGVVAGLLYRWATDQYGAILYLYFTCDVLYRLTRDGYVIPSKTFLDTVGMILLLAVVRFMYQRYLAFDKVQITAIPHRNDSFSSNVNL